MCICGSIKYIYTLGNYIKGNIYLNFLNLKIYFETIVGNCGLFLNNN